MGGGGTVVRGGRGRDCSKETIVNGYQTSSCNASGCEREQDG